MKTPLVSLIVPIYKVEAYLQRCVESILSQTYKNIEIILINDGSPDGCPQICDRYAAQNPRVKVIHKPNGGQSSARNAGLDLANGEYIAFVDSDDWIDKNMCADMVKLALSSGAEIVIGGFYTPTSNGERINVGGFENLTLDEARYAILSDTLPSYIWNKLYHASLFKDTRFEEGVIFEDLFIMPTLFYKARKIASIANAYYHYSNENEHSFSRLFGADKKYGLFRAWAQHETVARIYCAKQSEKCRQRAVKCAIAALVVNLAKPALKEAQTQKCRDYLSGQKGQKHPSVGVKYKILWWGLDNFMPICWFYSCVSFAQNSLKLRIKKFRG